METQGNEQNQRAPGSQGDYLRKLLLLKAKQFNMTPEEYINHSVKAVFDSYDKKKEMFDEKHFNRHWDFIKESENLPPSS